MDRLSTCCVLAASPRGELGSSASSSATPSKPVATTGSRESRIAPVDRARHPRRVSVPCLAERQRRSGACVYTADASVVGPDVDASGLYVGLTRGRLHSVAIVVGRTDAAARECLAESMQRGTPELTTQDAVRAAQAEMRRAARNSEAAMATGPVVGVPSAGRGIAELGARLLSSPARAQNWNPSDRARFRAAASRKIRDTLRRSTAFVGLESTAPTDRRLSSSRARRSRPERTAHSLCA